LVMYPLVCVMISPCAIHVALCGKDRAPSCYDRNIPKTPLLLGICAYHPASVCPKSIIFSGTERERLTGEILVSSVPNPDLAPDPLTKPS